MARARFSLGNGNPDSLIVPNLDGNLETVSKLSVHNLGPSEVSVEGSNDGVNFEPIGLFSALDTVTVSDSVAADAQSYQVRVFNQYRFSITGGNADVYLELVEA